MDEVKEKAKAEQIKVFQLINESNFYATLPGAMNPDASVGLFALMIESGKLHEPVNVMAVPLRELDVNIGPNGDIDDRFVTRHTKARFIKTLVGKSAVLSKKILGKIDKRPNEPATVKWGFWRCWDDDKFCWQKVSLWMTRWCSPRSSMATGRARCCQSRSIVILSFRSVPDRS
jgi:hypothetical protein